MVTIEDCVEAEEIVKADPGIQGLLKARYGITDMALVAADPWYYGDRFGELSVLPDAAQQTHRSAGMTFVPLLHYS